MLSILVLASFSCPGPSDPTSAGLSLVEPAAEEWIERVLAGPVAFEPPSRDGWLEGWIDEGSPFGVYVGLGLGITDARTSGGSLDRDLADHVVFATDSGLDSTFFGWRLYGGYRFDVEGPWSVELGYTDLGDLESEIVAAPPDLAAFRKTVEDQHPLSGRGVTLAGRYSHVVTDKLSVSGKLGAWWWSSTSEFDVIQPPAGTTVSTEVDETGIDLLLGIGAQHDLGRGLGLRVDWEKYFLEGDDTDLFSVSAVYTIN